MPVRLVYKTGIIAAVIVLICLVVAVACTRTFWPREVIVKVPTPQKLELPKREVPEEKKFSAKDWGWEISQEANRLADERVGHLLKENVMGVLLVKDGEAQTILYKQAAIANKDKGFTPLKKGVVYPVQWYSVYQGIGYGLPGDDRKGLCLLVWEPGTKKAPLTNPGFIHAIGKNIQLGNPQLP